MLLLKVKKKCVFNLKINSHNPMKKQRNNKERDTTIEVQSWMDTTDKM